MGPLGGVIFCLPLSWS